jgi:phosphatidylglycerol:prolipoprotein diacylglycerol transferase
MLLRCYPSVSDWFNHHLGTDIILPIHRFGFFVALAFIAAAVFTSLELKRKEKAGLMQPVIRKMKVGEPATLQQLIFNGLIGFIIGFKLLAAILDYSSCSSNPQEFLLSSKGNLIGGLIGAIVAAYLKYRQKAKQKLAKPKLEDVKVYPHQMLGDLVVVAAISGLVGAKIFSFLEDPEDFRSFLENPASGFFSGLTIYGGLILGTIAVIWFARRRKINVVHLADATAPALMLAYGIGRIGCQVSGDGDWGIPNTAAKPGWLSWLPDKLWAYDYPHNISVSNDYLMEDGVKIAELIPGCTEAHCTVLVPPVFPTPVYETIMCLILFGVLWAFRKRIQVPGLMISIYILMNGVERFLIEKIRVNTKYHFGNLEVTQAELVSSGMIVAGITLIVVLLRRRARTRRADVTRSG